jgi:hypothetical protein
MPPEAARFFLQLSFEPRDLERMHQLAVKHGEGKLTAAEQDELREYREAGLVLDLLRAKAKLSLKHANSDGSL